MVKIIGIRPSSFKGDNGEEVSGKNFYYVYALDKGEGHGAERVYLTDAKLSQLDFAPKVGDEVEIEFNRWGKCSGFRSAASNK